ncbi:tetratricopeptide repeat protein [Ancylostoma ceylanicum]|uniref:Tetratricopeptide repeat protein n=1 Tax=Ancylostoma ceylanicum TaxID=53326 RepID=A0A0D6LP65_9BILA|nr:tetratricopeptide repeat protein [Ancylostoma ceylanicum]
MDYSDNLLKTIASVHFYLREGHYGTALKICGSTEAGTPHIQLLKAIALNLNGRPAEAMRLLEPLRSGDYAFGALHALKQAHNMAETPDRQSLLEIESAISSIRDAPAIAQYSAAEALFFMKEYAKAKPFLEKIVKENPDNALFACLSGWTEISLGRDQKSTVEMFDRAIAGRYLDGYVGKMAVLAARQLANEMKALAKDALAASFGHMPFHVESARACLLAKEWNNTLQALQNSNIVEASRYRSGSDNVLIQFLLAVHSICSAGTKIESSLNELQTAIDAAEADNHALLANMANALYRMGARNRTVLAFSRELLARANKRSRRPAYVVDELRVAISLDDVREVTAKVKELMSMDTDDPYAALGVTLSNLMAGKLDDASAQFTFMKEANPNISNFAIYHFASAVITKYKDNSYEKFMSMVNDAIIVHFDKVQTMPFGVEYLRALDSDFLMGLIYQIMDYAPLVPMKSPNDTLKTAERILNILIEQSPGISQAYYILARCLFLHSEWDAADRMIDQCLQRNETVADAYLLRAEIKLMKGQVADADNCLNTGLSFNFAIRESSIFHLIKAKVHKQKNEIEKAADLLKAGLKLPQKERSTNLLARKEGGDGQRISIQLELIDCLQSLKQMHEAERVMEEAVQQWKGKPEEEQLLLMNAQIHIAKGDVDGALALLSTVQPGQPNYHSARMKMAEIYLEEKQDKTMFTLCYRELLKSAPTSATYALLGDAYMSVQEPEKAIEAYEMALKMSSKDMALTEKIGEAYVLCHLYSKAVNFYESVMNSTKDKRMRLKLADLLHQLGNTEKCMRILRQPLDEEPDPIDPATISAHVQYLKLLAEVQFEGGKHTEALNDLSAAKNLQMKLLAKNDSVANQQIKKEISKILCSQAEIYSNAHDHKMVIERYKEALTYFETDIKTILALANRYLTINKLVECKQLCEMALSIDKNNDEATLMVADMLYTNNDTDKAIVHFAQLLEKYPRLYGEYQAITRL